MKYFETNGHIFCTLRCFSTCQLWLFCIFIIEILLYQALCHSYLQLFLQRKSVTTHCRQCLVYSLVFLLPRQDTKSCSCVYKVCYYTLLYSQSGSFSSCSFYFRLQTVIIILKYSTPKCNMASKTHLMASIYSCNKTQWKVLTNDEVSVL